MERSPFIYRSFNLERDLSAIVSLLRDIERADQVGEVVTEAALREQLTWAGQDPSLNNWVVALPDDGFLIGYGFVQKTPNDDNADLYIAVHPAFRRQGIGSQLFTHLLKRARELDAQALRVYANVRNKGADLFVRKHSFEPVSTYTRLSVPETQTFPAPVLPQGFTIRSYDQIERVDLYTQALNRCYEGQWGHLHVTEEDIAPFLAQLNHSGNFLLFAPDGNIVGFCRADLNPENETPAALIDAPGIILEYRDSNLVLPLLLTAIHWLLPQGPAVIELESWGDTSDTIALYRSLGFQTIKEEISYRRDMK